MVIIKTFKDKKNENLHDFLPANKRLTFQKLKIFEYLKSVDTHPTAEMVFSVISKDLPTITLATVYRNLNSLYEDNLINRFNLDGEYHFDGNNSLHLHFYCLRCGKIEDIFDSVLLSKLKNLLKNYYNNEKNNLVFRSDHFIYGLCSDCRLKNEDKN